MKSLWSYVFLLIFSASVLDASSGTIDAQTTVQLVNELHTFADGDSAIGFVRFAKGFTAQGDMALGVLFPVDGPITLSDTGVVTLQGNLTLDPDATFPNGGIFTCDRTQTIFLNGNLTIPQDKTLTCTGCVIIDGQGHQLKFEQGAKLVIDGDPNTKVRLRNIQIKGLQDYTRSGHTIEFGSAINQTLTLDNVNLILSDNFTFDGGLLRIKNVVSIQGEYCIFRYRAPYHCKILKDSTLFIDIISGFLYSPSDGKPNHIVMKDVTSRLFLNGAIFAASGQTGCILKTGHMILDHNVIFRNINKTTKDYGIIFGTGTEEEDLEIDILPGASIDIAEGFLTYRNVY
ncbi:MAG: hypothetical protein V1855_00875 [bacterium]